jgi:uncharacterized protein (TIGR03437 family)
MIGRGLLMMFVGLAGLPSQTLAPWQQSWDEFIKAYQTCLSDKNCDLNQFFGKDITWQGTYNGSSPNQFSGGLTFLAKMTPGSMTDRNGKTVDVQNILGFSAATPSAWQALAVGTPVRFRSTVSSLTGFVGLTSSCCFIVSLGTDVQLLGDPFISPGGVTDGASFRAVITSGSWFTIRGSNLSATTRTWTASDFQGNQLPKSIDGVSVRIGGKGAPVYFVSPAQINALVPDDLLLGDVDVVVTAPAGVASAKATVQAFAPAFFVFDAQGGKYPAAVHVDGTFLGPIGLLGNSVTTTPAQVGDRLLLYGTGFGPTTPRFPSDQIPGVAPLTDVSQLKIQIGGKAVTADFAGLVGPGLYQFNVTVPDLQGGDQGLAAQIGGASTQQGVFVSVLRQPTAGAYLISSIAGNGVADFAGDGSPAVSASLNRPAGVAIDSSGALYIAEQQNNRVRRITNGVITTVAGSGVAGDAGDGGPATQAQLAAPLSVALARDGSIYIADTARYRVRKVSAGTNLLTTVVGAVGRFNGFSGDGGPATAAGISQPYSVAFDGTGNLYLADTLNQRIRKVAAGTNVITTLAGSGTPDVFSGGFGGDGGLATSSRLNNPAGVTVDSSGNIYIADTGNHRVRRVAANTGVITTVAGTGTAGYSGDGVATATQLNSPSGVAVDGSGNIYIADTGNNRIRRIELSTGTLSTIAGTGVAGFGGDGGSATDALLNAPWGLALDATGRVYVADLGNHRVRLLAKLQ